MRHAFVLLMALAFGGCVNYTALCHGDEPGQYYMLRRQSFIFFSHQSVVEFQKAATGPDKGLMRMVRKVYPAEYTDNRPIGEPGPTKEQPPAATKEERPWKAEW